MKQNEINPEEFPSEEDEQIESVDSDQEQPKTDDALVDKLLDANQELEKKLKDSQDQLLRSQAEIQNIKKHNQQDQANLIKYDGQKLATAILPSIDNLQRALQAQAEEHESAIVTGVEMVLKQLQQALSENNITEIVATDVKFDPTLHQAVQMVPADDEHEPETVVQVLQTGYKLKDRVLRPSMVVVAQ
ncbi:nucleotide exchange factor GrpE [Bombilactobacillus thymidiniphilus]|uniref:Protein GrpE n=1 Tax=Bombilactobacillus thymidiniphilus TaxID=2923363 RepID=A0ABY4PCM0_9LACO|nr:nucleotide exchange factor GrpE [Bombilactobacillus thymidiniphilus]UQS83508.1 nucleotide exchange factor GrpE [Bombilactobacillus thymidiniphilus]